ncbi:hypothetical protein CGRA01v4_11896 [Colletotrichum graminicola]|nr:hypothetical protein CGRA01v4_11896 [Colletotrichum graminicola]
MDSFFFGYRDTLGQEGEWEGIATWVVVLPLPRLVVQSDANYVHPRTGIAIGGRRVCVSVCVCAYVCRGKLSKWTGGR